MHFPTDVKYSEERGNSHANARETVLCAEKPLAATGERNSFSRPLPPPTLAKRTGRMAGVPRGLRPPSCCVSPAGRVLSPSEQQPLPLKAVPMDGSKSGTRTFIEGPTLWQAGFYLRRQPGPQLTLMTSSSLRVSEGERSHTTLSKQASAFWSFLLAKPDLAE